MSFWLSSVFVWLFLIAWLGDFEIVLSVCVCLLQIPGVVTMNRECWANVVFENPVDLMLTNCTLTLSGSGLLRTEIELEWVCICVFVCVSAWWWIRVCRCRVLPPSCTFVFSTQTWQPEAQQPFHRPIPFHSLQGWWEDAAGWLWLLQFQRHQGFVHCLHQNSFPHLDTRHNFVTCLFWLFAGSLTCIFNVNVQNITTFLFHGPPTTQISRVVSEVLSVKTIYIILHHVKIIPCFIFCLAGDVGTGTRVPPYGRDRTPHYFL